MNQLLWVLVQNTVVVAALLPIVWGLSKWRRNHPAERHLLWLVLLVKLILPPLWAVGQCASFDSLANRLEPDNETGVGESLDLALPAIQVEHRLLIDEPSEDISSVELPTRTFPELAVDCITWFWLLGTVVYAASTARKVVRELKLIWRSKPAPERLVERVRSTANAGLPKSRDASPIGRHFLRLNEAARRLRLKRISVRVSSSLHGPVVLWWLGPVVLWPTSMLDITDQYDEIGILAHELEHVRRGDHLLAWLEMLVAAVHWWNPVFWLVRRQLYETREMACDAVALHDETRSRREYVETLFWLTSGQALGSTPPAAIGLGAVSHSFFRRRLTMIFDRNVNGRLSTGGLFMAACLGMLCCAGFSRAQSQSGVAQSTPLVTPPRDSNSIQSPPARPGGSADSSSVQERGQTAIDKAIRDAASAADPASVQDRIRAAIDTFIREAASAEERNAAEVLKDSFESEIRVTEEEMRKAYDKVFQRYMYLKALQEAQAKAAAASPDQANDPRRNNATLKYEIQLAELAVQEKMIERDHLAKELAAVSAEVKKGTATPGDQLKIEYKAKLAELAVRRAEVELAKLNSGGKEKSTAKLFDSSSGNPYQSH